METVLSDARVRAARAQEFIAPGRAISTNHVDLATRIIERGGQIAQQVEQPWIEMEHCSCTVVAKEMVKLVQRFGYVSVPATVNDVEALTRVGMMQPQAIFAHRRSSR